MTASEGVPLRGTDLTEAISAEMVALYGHFYGHDQIADGRSSEVLDGRVAFQVAAQDEFTAMIERLTGRAVTAFLSSNQTSRGVASELFFLEAE